MVPFGPRFGFPCRSPREEKLVNKDALVLAPCLTLFFVLLCGLPARGVEMCSFVLPPQVLPAGWRWQLPLPSAIFFFLILRNSPKPGPLQHAHLCEGASALGLPQTCRCREKGVCPGSLFPSSSPCSQAPHTESSRETGKLRLQGAPDQHHSKCGPQSWPRRRCP